MNRLHLFGSAALLAATIIPRVSLAADPTVAGSTRIGTNDTYGPNYSAFWRNGFDYSLLTNGTHTYLNAPSASGNLYFRGANSTWLTLNASTLTSGVSVMANKNLTVKGTTNLIGDSTVGGLLSVTGVTNLGQSLTVSGDTIFAGQVTASNGLKAVTSGNVALFGSSNSGSGVLGHANKGKGVAGNTLGSSLDAWGGYFTGLANGVYGQGLIYGVYSEGPAFVTGALTVNAQAFKPGGEILGRHL